MRLGPMNYFTPKRKVKKLTKMLPIFPDLPLFNGCQ